MVDKIEIGSKPERKVVEKIQNYSRFYLIERKIDHFLIGRNMLLLKVETNVRETVRD